MFLVFLLYLYFYPYGGLSFFSFISLRAILLFAGLLFLVLIIRYRSKMFPILKSVFVFRLTSDGASRTARNLYFLSLMLLVTGIVMFIGYAAAYLFSGDTIESADLIKMPLLVPVYIIFLSRYFLFFVNLKINKDFPLHDKHYIKSDLKISYSFVLLLALELLYVIMIFKSEIGGAGKILGSLAADFDWSPELYHILMLFFIGASVYNIFTIKEFKTGFFSDARMGSIVNSLIISAGCFFSFTNLVLNMARLDDIYYFYDQIIWKSVNPLIFAAALLALYAVLRKVLKGNRAA